MKESIICIKSLSFAEMTFKFGLIQENIIAKQLMSSGISIGANIKEAQKTKCRRVLLLEEQICNIDYTSYSSAVIEIIKILNSISKTIRNSYNFPNCSLPINLFAPSCFSHHSRLTCDHFLFRPFYTSYFSA